MQDNSTKKCPLSWRTKLCYGVGHVLNDLCASMWFSYLLIFYEKVLEFPSTQAGLVLLVGQIADGLATPVVGILADKENKIPICARYGRRKVWHLIGTIFVLLSFPFIFSPCLGGCQDADENMQLAYYCAFVCMFQFGWASVQISHLALIPDLTPNKHQRTELNSIRYGFTVIANLSVFAITYLILEMDVGGSSTDPSKKTSNSTPSTEEESLQQIGPDDVDNFKTVALICMAIGGLFSIIFHIGTKENPYVKRTKENRATEIPSVPSAPSIEAVHRTTATTTTTSEVTKPDLTKELQVTTSVTTCGLPQAGMPRCQLNGSLSQTDDAMMESPAPVPEADPPQQESTTGRPCSKSRRRMHLVDWFKEPQFYQVAVLYMATRLFVNLYQVYVPLYVQKTLGLRNVTVATVPFVIYLAGFIGSLVMKQINKKIGRKGTFILGCIIGLCGSLWVLIGATNENMSWEVYIVAIFLGTGGSTLLITSLSITADLIGNNVEGGAFVYGAMSLVDKFSNGIIIMVIQESNTDEPSYYTQVIGYACGSSCVLGILITLTLLTTKIGKRRRASLAPSIFEDDIEESESGIDNPALCTDEKESEFPQDKERF